MKRIHFFELGDQSWFPNELRRDGMELLAAMEDFAQSYRDSAKILSDLGGDSIVVLAAGSGGGIQSAVPHLKATITFTDLYPDERFHETDQVKYERGPVDATNVPSHLKGTRAIYTAFHHFKPELARKILEDAVRAKEPIAVFEVTERNVRSLILIWILPFLTLAITPFIRPFRWSRLLWTYLIPAIPLFVLFDGFVSCLRTYSKEELEAMTKDLTEFEWHFTKLKTRFGLEHPSGYTGRPKSEFSQRITQQS